MMSEQSDLNAAWESVNTVWHTPGVDPHVADALQPVLVALAPYRDSQQARTVSRTVFQWRDFYESECLRMLKVFAPVLLVACLVSGCASTQRHYAVTADYAFATAVNAVDDALFSACQAHSIPADTCNNQVKPAMINVQTSVKAASLTLRALPDNAQMPRSVPDLLDALHKVQGVLDSLGDLTQPAVARVVAMLSHAVDEAVKLLYVFTPVLEGQ